MKKQSINTDKIKEYRDELERFEDYIPLYFEYFINSPKRIKYLQTLTNFEDIFKERLKHRKELNLSNDPNKYHFKDVKKWCNTNKKYKTIIYD